MVSGLKVNCFYNKDLVKFMISESIQKNRYKLFSVGAIGTFMATLDGSILNVALPTISKDFGASIDVVAWVAMAYSLTLISLMLVFGSWINKKGYYFGYRFGYVLFLVGSILCALSGNIYMLVASRVIQAVGTAMFVAIGPGMVTTVFGEKERGKGIGMMVMMVSAGFMVGPPLGGFILSYFSWHFIFLINLPIGLLALYMTFKYISLLEKPEGGKKQNLISAFGISGSLLSLTIFLSFINDYKLTDIRMIGLAVLSVGCMILFLVYESKPDKAMIGIDVFKNRQFTSSIAAMLFMFMALAGLSILIPFYLENVMGYEPKQVGLFLIILPIMMFIFAPLSGKLSDKIGYRFLTVFGVLVLMGGFQMASMFTPESSVLWLIATFSMVGIGNGIFNTPNSSALMGSVSEKHRAVTSSILGTTRNIGMSIGVALSTVLFAFFQAKYAGMGTKNEIFIMALENVCYVANGMLVFCLIASLVRQNKPETVQKPEIK